MVSFILRPLNTRRNLKVCHPCCVRSIIQGSSFYISIYTHSHEYNNIVISSNILYTTTCFGPVCRPSSACTKNLLSDYTVCMLILEGATRSRLTSEIVGLVKVEINMLRGYINCEHLIILTCTL